MEMTVEKIQAIMAEAEQAAKEAAKKYFIEVLWGRDQLACGFAWVNIYGIKGNTKLGKMLKQAGIRQDYTRTFQIWNPAKYHCQNVDTLYVGAEAYAKVLQSYGFEAYAGSRLD